MRAELLKILDESYSTTLFASPGSPDPTTPKHCISLLSQYFCWKCERPLPQKQLLQLSQIISLGQVIVQEKSSSNIDKLVDIYNVNKFGMEHPCQLQAAPICTLKEMLVYHYLSKCKVWPTICKQLNKSKDKEYKLRCLIEWFVEFVKRVGIKDMFEPDALSRKDLKTVTKKKLINASNSQLTDAVTYKDYDKVQELLSQGIDVESITPLKERQEVVTRLRASHIACDNGDLKMCKILTNFKVDWEAEDSEKMSPIFYAIKSGSMQLIQYLVEEMKVKIEKLEIQKRTPFYWACTQGDMTIIKYLHSKGADINSSSEIGRTALSKACFLGRIDIVEYLLNCKQVNMNNKDKKGRTPLHNAVFGPKGGREAHKFGTFSSDSPQCAILLLERGVDANQTDNDGNTGLHVALSSSAIASIPVLIAYGGSIKQRNRFQETPIMVGCKFGHSDAVRILVENYHDDVTTKDFVGCNPLVLVAKNLKGPKDEAHPLFNYLLPIYVDQILKKEDSIHDIADTFEKLIANKASKELLMYFKHIRQKKIPLKIDPHTIIKCLQGFEEEVPLTLMSAETKKEHEIVHIITHVVKARKMGLLENILNLYNKELFETTFPIEFLQETVDVNDKLITQVITLLNIDIIQGRLDGGKNILHFLVENRKMGTLIQLLKIYTDSYHAQIRNRYLLKFNKGQLKKVLKEQLTETDIENGMTCAEISLIRKYFDILKILENYLQQYTDKDHNLVSLHHFKIEEYNVVKETDVEELEKFKGHQKIQQVNDLIDKCNSMKEQHLLDKINHITKTEEALRNQISHLDDTMVNHIFKLFKEKRKIYLCQTQQQLVDSVNSIADSSVLAIDLEYYTEDDTGVNFICTLQLSCAYRDFVIDCLRIPFPLIKKHLQSFMHNPFITKVLHGCDKDLLLLKSNFNISLVNTMDTARIEMILTSKTQMTGLKNLAQKYLNGLKMSKQYQTSEWRLRPLPKAMLQYARCDSLNLLLIYLKILNAIPVDKVTDVVVSNLKVALKNTKPGVDLIRQIKPRKAIQDN